jgi:hypothetical protein
MSSFHEDKSVEIRRELMLCFADDGRIPASAKHQIPDFKISRVSVEEDSPPGKRSLDDIDTAIMKRLLEV